MAQRIVRAKRTLTAAQRALRGADRARSSPPGSSSVLEVIYLVFNEGYSATAGEDWMRPALCQEALRLGRILAELTPGGARGARPGRADGDPGLAAARAGRRGRRAGAAARPGPRPLGPGADPPRAGRAGARRAQSARALGPYALQAAIAACHARARTVEETDWARIAALYEALAELTPSPVVELNRAVAVSRAYGPAAGLELVDALTDVPALRGYHLLPSVRGDLLASSAGGTRRAPSSSAPPR